MGQAASGRALDVLEDALDRPEHDRELWLTAAHGDDPALVESVRRLLARAASGHAALPTEPPQPRARGPARPPPERIGAYRLTEPLGEGGMGVVWRAERDDGLFEHVVAAKLIRGARLDERTAARFAVERRALARLSHPNIARLLDGGVTPDGEPYILMDYVDGEPVTDTVVRRDLDPRATVRLMLGVCEAVAAAHRKLVVHGDIKPSNVLVTPEGEPRLLDFGVARLLEADPALEGALPVTAAYASPERRAGEPPAVPDDVHALGVLLRELLARAGPTLSHTAPRPLDVDLGAIADKAAAEQPERRYGAVDALAADLARWLDKRPVEARGPSRAYAARRYVARHPLAVAAAVLAVLALTLTAAVTSALYLQAEAARRDADRRFADARGMANYLLFDVYDRLDETPRSLAVRRDLAAMGQRYLDRLSADPRAPEEVRLEAVRGLVRLGGVQGGARGRNLGQPEAARANLDAAVFLAERLAREQPERADVALSLAEARLEQAMLAVERRGESGPAERGLLVAREDLERAVRLGADADAAARVGADLRLQTASLRIWQARYPEGAQSARAAIAMLERLSNRERATMRVRLLEARAHDQLGEALWYGGGEAAAVPAYRTQLRLARALVRDRPADPNALRSLGYAEWALGTTLLSVDRTAEALPVLADAVRHGRDAAGFDPDDDQSARNLLIAQQAYAQALVKLGRFAEALPILENDVAVRAERVRAQPAAYERRRDQAISTASLGDAYMDAGRTSEACGAYARAVALWDGLRREGRASALDVGHGVRLIAERANGRCPSLAARR